LTILKVDIPLPVAPSWSLCVICKSRVAHLDSAPPDDGWVVAELAVEPAGDDPEAG